MVKNKKSGRSKKEKVLICPNCFQKINENDTRCLVCGYNLSSDNEILYKEDIS